MKTLILCSLFAVCAFAQTSIYIGGGPSLDATYNVTTGICTNDSGTCALVNYAAHASFGEIKTALQSREPIAYTATAGVRKVVATVENNVGKVDLFALLDAGAAVSGTGPSFAGAAGGGLTFHPRRIPNWGITVAAQGAYSPANQQTAADGKTKSNVFLQVGYTFRGK